MSTPQAPAPTPFNLRLQALRECQDFGEQGGVVPVVDLAATSTFLDPVDMERVFRGELAGCYLYSRHSNPTVNALGRKLAALEGAPAALGVASGMAAIACTLEQLLRAGEHVVASRSVYGGTYALLANLFPRRNVQTTFVDITRLDLVEAAIRPETRVLYAETLSNPLLEVADLEGLAQLARRRGLTFVLDNTFAPMVVTPYPRGPDVVVYSCTKYLSGASDLIGGAVVATQEFIAQLIDVNAGAVMLTGPVMDARIAHELYLRLDHLPLRMMAHSRAALHLAAAAEAEGFHIFYPGLASHPGYRLFREISNLEVGAGGMLTLDCGSRERALRLAGQLQAQRFGLYAVSLGFSRTLMSCPSVSTSSEIPVEEQSAMGLSPGLLRLSIGFVGDTESLTQTFLRVCREEGVPVRADFSPASYAAGSQPSPHL